MITINYRGRLGNNLIQYAAGAILAGKTGLSLGTKPESRNNNFGEAFSLQPIDGVCYDNTIKLNDKNYYAHYYNPEPNTGYILNGFFQNSRLLCDYRKQILDLYKLPEPKESVSLDDVFIACRLGDCLTGHRTYCSMVYIEDQLKASRHKYDKAYVTSDTITHPPLKRLIEKYDLTVYQDEPMDTILFGAQFNNLILSAGSFSYLMAYFSKADNVTVYRSKQDPLQRQRGWNYNNKVKLI